MLTESVGPDQISFVGLASPPSSRSVYWLIANRSCHFLKGWPSDCGSSLAWKCLEGFVPPLKPPADSGGYESPVSSPRVEQLRMVVYAEELAAGSGWISARNAPCFVLCPILLLSLPSGFSWEPSLSRSCAHRAPAQALLVRNLT